MFAHLVAVFVAFLICSESALAADGHIAAAPEAVANPVLQVPVMQVPVLKVPVLQVPGGDIFGFTSGTDVGEPGDKGYASENSGRGGKTGGNYWALSTKYQFGATLFENVAGAVSVFTASHFIDNISIVPDKVSRLQFDGVSGEIYKRIIERSASNPFAVTVGIEPRWGRVDGLTGSVTNGYAVEAKVYIDAVVVPEKLYFALNLTYAPGSQKFSDAGAKWVAGSGTNVSTSLTYQWSERLFSGVELRYLAGFGGAFLNRLSGQALYFGPTLFYKITDKISFNAVWTPQVAGRSQSTKEGVLDLDNFERHQFRVKLAVAF